MMNIKSMLWAVVVILLGGIVVLAKNNRELRTQVLDAVNLNVSSQAVNEEQKELIDDLQEEIDLRRQQAIEQQVHISELEAQLANATTPESDVQYGFELTEFDYSLEHQTFWIVHEVITSTMIAGVQSYGALPSMYESIMADLNHDCDGYVTSRWNDQERYGVSGRAALGVLPEDCIVTLEELSGQSLERAYNPREEYPQVVACYEELCDPVSDTLSIMLDESTFWKRENFIDPARNWYTVETENVRNFNPMGWGPMGLEHLVPDTVSLLVREPSDIVSMGITWDGEVLTYTPAGKIHTGETYTGVPGNAEPVSMSFRTMIQGDIKSWGEVTRHVVSVRVSEDLILNWEFMPSYKGDGVVLLHIIDLQLVRLSPTQRGRINTGFSVADSEVYKPSWGDYVAFEGVQYRNVVISSENTYWSAVYSIRDSVLIMDANGNLHRLSGWLLDIDWFCDENGNDCDSVNYSIPEPGTILWVKGIRIGEYSGTQYLEVYIRR